MPADYTLFVKTKGDPMTKEEIAATLPCPFCGGQAYIRDEVIVCVPIVYVECLICHAHGPEVPIEKDRREIRKAALKLWNERISDMQKRTKEKCVTCGMCFDKETPYCVRSEAILGKEGETKNDNIEC